MAADIGGSYGNRHFDWTSNWRLAREKTLRQAPGISPLSTYQVILGSFTILGHLEMSEQCCLYVAPAFDDVRISVEDRAVILRVLGALAVVPNSKES